MKVKWRILGLALALIAVWLFLIFFVFLTGSEGKENETFLPPGTAAVVYHEGMTFIQSPNPEDVERALSESEPPWWIGTGKWIAGGSVATATLFYFAALDIPVVHPFWIGKGVAAGLCGVFTGIAAGAGMSVIWVDSRRPKLTWEEAKFYVLSPEEQAGVMKSPDGKITVIKREAKGKYILIKTLFLVDGFLVILKQETNLPLRTLLKGKILYFKGKPVLPSQKLEKGEKIEFFPSEILVIY